MLEEGKGKYSMRLGLKAWLCANTWSRHAKQLIPHDSVSLCVHKMRVCGYDWFEVCVKSAYSHYTFLLTCVRKYMFTVLLGTHRLVV